jgi:cytidylate kinase
MRAFVLVGGWPGSGTTTLTRALAPELALPYGTSSQPNHANHVAQ